MLCKIEYCAVQYPLPHAVLRSAIKDRFPFPSAYVPARWRNPKFALSNARPFFLNGTGQRISKPSSPSVYIAAHDHRSKPCRGVEHRPGTDEGIVYEFARSSQSLVGHDQGHLGFHGGVSYVHSPLEVESIDEVPLSLADLIKQKKKAHNQDGLSDVVRTTRMIWRKEGARTFFPIQTHLSCLGIALPCSKTVSG